MKVVDNAYEFGQTVYLKTDVEQKPRMVTGFLIRPISCTYELTQGTQISWHYDFEISTEKDVMATTTN